MAENGNMERDIGRLEGRVEALEICLRDVGGDVKVIRSAFDQAKGGWKTIAVIAGCASLLTTIGTEIVISGLHAFR